MTKFYETAQYISGVDETVVEYKVDVPASQKAGDHFDVITFMAMEKLPVFFQVNWELS